MQNLLKSLLTAKRSINNPVKDSKNPHFKNNYASLESVLDAVTGPLLEHGLVITQTLEPNSGIDQDVCLVTTIWHAESGESLSSKVLLSPTKRDPQGYAAACTYYRRMSLKSLLGLAEVDDDGTEASRPAVPQKPAHGPVTQKVMDKIGGTIVPDMDAMTLCGKMREAKSMQELDALASKAKALPQSERGEVREVYASMKEELS